MQLIYVSELLQDEIRVKIGIKIPESVKREDSFAFVEGMEYILKSLDKPSDLKRAISHLAHEGIIIYLD